MGRWDEDTRKKHLNEKLERKILKWNNFMLNPPNRILKYFFFILLLPSKLVHKNGKCSKFIQKHIIIISPLEYAVIVGAIMFTMLFLVDLLPSFKLKIIAYIGFYLLTLFFGMATSKGGGRKKDDSLPTDDRGNEIIIGDKQK